MTNKLLPEYFKAKDHEEGAAEHHEHHVEEAKIQKVADTENTVDVHGVPKILPIDQSQSEALDIKKEDDDGDVSIEIQTQFDESYLTYLR